MIEATLRLPTESYLQTTLPPPSVKMNAYDVEKNQGYAQNTGYLQDNSSGSPGAHGNYEKHHGSYVEPDGAVPGETFTYGDSSYAKMQRFAAKFKIELRGIERVPEDERTDKGFKALLNVSTMVCAECTTDSDGAR